MLELNIEDVISRLNELRTYRPLLAKRMDYEEELPEDAVPFLVERIEASYARCELATAANRDDACGELSVWLIRSFRFYLARLAMGGMDNLWRFRFSGTECNIHH